MSAKVIVPGSTFTGVPKSRPTALAYDLTAGALGFIEPGSAAAKVTTVPATGGVFPDLVKDLTAVTVGSDPGDFPVTNGIVGASAKSKAELTAKGGFHFINSRTAQVSPYETFDVGLGAARLGYVNAHPTNKTYLGVHFAVSRVADAAYTLVNMAYGLRKGDPNQTGSDRWVMVGPNGSTLTPWPSSVGDATRLLGNLTRRDGSGPGFYRFFAAVASTSAPASFTAVDRIIRMGSYSAGNLNKLPSMVTYRLWLEDLTASGRSFDYVSKIDQAEYVADHLTAGGNYYGDTWSDPATVLP